MSQMISPVFHDVLWRAFFLAREYINFSKTVEYIHNQNTLHHNFVSWFDWMSFVWLSGTLSGS